MCLIDHIPELIRAGISSFKIEGRMKGINYLSSVVKTYRSAIDSFMAAPEAYTVKPEWHSELYQVYHRPYCTGFYFGHPNETSEKSLNSHNKHEGKVHSFIGKIIEMLSDSEYLIEIRNKMVPGDKIEVLSPKGVAQKARVVSLTNEKGDIVDNAKPNSRVIAKIPLIVSPNDIVRKI